MKLDNTSLNLGTGIVLRKTAVEQNAAFKKVSETYNEWAKLVFLFDVSGSMDVRVAHDINGAGFADQFIWPADMSGIRATMQAHCDKINPLINVGAWFGPEDPHEEKLVECLLMQVGGGYSVSVTDEDIKNIIIKQSAMSVFDIMPDFTKRHQVPPSRIEIVRKLAAQEITARFKKYPNSLVTAIAFGDTSVVLQDNADEKSLVLSVSGLNTDIPGTGGGTDILNAVDCGVQACTKSPSPVGIHHFVLVTDGGDYNAGRELPNWVPNLKASGITIDYIHIGEASETNNGIKAACEALGGSYVCVNTEKEIETKFVEVVRRAMLPPASV